MRWVASMDNWHSLDHCISASCIIGQWQPACCRSKPEHSGWTKDTGMDLCNVIWEHLVASLVVWKPDSRAHHDTMLGCQRCKQMSIVSQPHASLASDNLHQDTVVGLKLSAFGCISGGLACNFCHCRLADLTSDVLSFLMRCIMFVLLKKCRFKNFLIDFFRLDPSGIKDLPRPQFQPQQP